ncbi:MAG: hypothetical protein ACO1PN_17555 [Betaproteobacteria bacterium]
MFAGLVAGHGACLQSGGGDFFHGCFIACRVVMPDANTYCRHRASIKISIKTNTYGGYPRQNCRRNPTFSKTPEQAVVFVEFFCLPPETAIVGNRFCREIAGAVRASTPFRHQYAAACRWSAVSPRPSACIRVRLMQVLAAEIMNAQSQSHVSEVCHEYVADAVDDLFRSGVAVGGATLVPANSRLKK